MKCSRCKKENVPLLKHAKNKSGTQYFMCRECNTLRATAYRNTEKGRERIYMAIRKLRAKQKAKQKLTKQYEVTSHT